MIFMAIDLYLKYKSASLIVCCNIKAIFKARETTYPGVASLTIPLFACGGKKEFEK